jgi:tetraacyldisaccharide 4'-kinase
MRFPSRLLAPAAALYRLATVIDRRRKSQQAFVSSLPVISVGNISVGGSGKSQLVRALLGPLQQRHPVLLLSRGYGRTDRNDRIWRSGDREPDPALFGDEPAMLSEDFSNGVIGVAADRARLLASIEGEHRGSIVLLDDGFQHHRLARDLDIVLVDDRTAVDGRMLPAGRLREHPSALRRADLVLCEGVDAERFVAQWAPDVTCLSMRVETRGVTSVVPGRAVPAGRPLLVTGISGPERVRRSLSDLGYTPSRELSFRDHQRYTAEIARSIVEKMRSSGAEWIVTTTKDAVKLRRLPEVRDLLYVLDVAMVVGEMPRLLARIENAIVAKRGATR